MSFEISDLKSEANLEIPRSIETINIKYAFPWIYISRNQCGLYIRRICKFFPLSLTSINWMALMELNEWKKVYSFNLDKKLCKQCCKIYEWTRGWRFATFYNRSHASCIIIKQHDEKRNTGNELKVFLVQPLGYK